MTCSEFDLLIVSDEPDTAAQLHDHASGCPRCAEILAGQAELLREVATWKESTPAPPPQLEQRILQAATEQGQEPVRAPGRLLRFPRRPTYAWGAIAATLILAALLVARTVPWAQAPQEANRLLVAEALKDAVRAEREHARAIARLEQAAAPILARSEDTSLAASKAAVLTPGIVPPKAAHNTEPTMRKRKIPFTSGSPPLRAVQSDFYQFEPSVRGRAKLRRALP